MRKLLLMVLAVGVLLSLCGAATAAAWTHMGTAGWSYPSATAGNLGAVRRIRFSGLAVDSAGNVYAGTNADQNTGVDHGGITIFRPGGAKVEVDLNALGFPGSVTKIVIGGDDYAYALQNWNEISFGGAFQANRILQITPDGVVTQIWCPKKDTETGCPITTANRIGGMTVGGDGNIYWTANGVDSYWKVHFLWRYSVGGGEIEEAPHNGSNDGWTETHRMFDLEWAGGDWFCVIGSQSGSTYRADAISWTQNRRMVTNGISTPAWRDYVTATAYDPVREQLWIGGRGAGSVSGVIGTSNVMTRFRGDTADDSPSMFNTLGTSIAGSDVWHANGNVLDATKISNFSGRACKNYPPCTGPSPGTQDDAGYWVQAMAIEPESGGAWMSFGASPTYTWDDLGKVFIRGQNVGSEFYDAGAPEPGSIVMGLACFSGRMYALTCSPITGVYNLYSTSDLVPAPVFAASVGAMKTFPVKNIGRTVRTPEVVVNLPYPVADLGGGDRLYDFYGVQALDRSAGIKVTPVYHGAYTLIRGDRVVLQGIIDEGSLNKELVLRSASVIGVANPGQAPAALGTRLKDAGGVKAGYQAALPPGEGLTDVGLLVKVAGKVTEVTADGTGTRYFYRVDDGSGIALGSAAKPGVKVGDNAIFPTVQVGDFVSVIGLLSTELDGATLVPVVVFDPADSPTRLAP